MTKPEKLCYLGLILFVTSYIMFSMGKEFAYSQKPIDFAHWANLIGAVLLYNFNYVFPTNKLNSLAGFFTTLGVIGHIGLCTLDFLMWSYGTDNVSRMELGNHINNTPSIFYPFQIMAPAFLFIGLSLHGWNFIKTNPISALMIILGPTAVGISYFSLNNGVLAAISCLIFALGLALLLYKNGHKKLEAQKVKN